MTREPTYVISAEKIDLLQEIQKVRLYQKSVLTVQRVSPKRYRKVIEKENLTGKMK